MEDNMGILSRVKLSLDEYLKLPKNANRDPETAKEILDPVPIAPPVGWYKQPSMFDQVRDMVRSEHMRLYAQSQGAETFEEASDFNVEDDIFPASQYEDPADFEPLADMQQRRQAEFEREWRKKYEARLKRRAEREMADEDRQSSAERPMPSSEPARPAGQGSPKATREALDAPKGAAG